MAFHERSIQIAKHSSDMVLTYTPEERAVVFWHELTHAILEDMGPHRLYLNEKFVDAFSKRLAAAIKNATFK